MQPVGAPLPELDRAGDEAEPSPIRRSDDRVRRAGIEACSRYLHLRTGPDHGALRTYDRTDTAGPRSGVEVLVTLGVTHALDVADHAHLALQRTPSEVECGTGVDRQLPPLAALIVREPAESAFVATFQKHRPRRRSARRIGRGQGHGVRLIETRLVRSECFVEPATELEDRIGINVALDKCSARIVLAQVGKSRPFRIRSHRGILPRPFGHCRTHAFGRGMCTPYTD